MLWVSFIFFLPLVHCDNEYCTDQESCNDRVILLECPQSTQATTVISNYLVKMEDSASNNPLIYLLTGDNKHTRLTDRSQFDKYCNNNITNTISNIVLTTFTTLVTVLSFDRPAQLEIVVLISTVIEKNYFMKEMTDVIQLSSSDKHSYHFFITPSTVSSDLFGSAEFAVTYGDGTHYNKALTLSELIKNGHGDCLQAHLLSKGVFITVNNFNNLLKFKFPSFTDVFGSPYPDRCVSITCGNGHYCSVLHGCVELSKNRVSTGNNHVLLNEEHFSLAHSPSYHVAGAMTDDYQILSILQNNTATKTMSLSNIVDAELNAIDWSVNKPFIERLIEDDRPALLRNTVVNSWKANSSWSIKYVCDNIDEEILVNVKCSNSYITFDPDYSAPLKLNISIPYVVRNMTKDSFIGCVENTTSCDYKGYYYFNRVPKTLLHDIKPNEYLFHTEKDMNSQKQFIWVSSQGMITHGHFDQDYNVFVQLVGEKKFILWSPWQHELMYVYPRVHPMWHKSRINFANPNIVKFPNFANSKAIEVVVQPGDVLYIPPYTWHYVETLSPSVSLSTWSHDYHMYSHMNAIYGHDHKFDLLQNSTGKPISN